jgi:hypothetical protein
MRLIDVDELRWAIRNNAPKSVPIWVYQTIDNAPTAYDPDKVVEQLEELRKECEDPLQDYNPNYFIDKAIKIVKGGGVK